MEKQCQIMKSKSHYLLLLLPVFIFILLSLCLLALCFPAPHTSNSISLDLVCKPIYFYDVLLQCWLRSANDMKFDVPAGIRTDKVLSHRRLDSLTLAQVSQISENTNKAKSLQFPGVVLAEGALGCIHIFHGKTHIPNLMDFELGNEFNEVWRLCHVPFPAVMAFVLPSSQSTTNLNIHHSAYAEFFTCVQQHSSTPCFISTQPTVYSFYLSYYIALNIKWLQSSNPELFVILACKCDKQSLPSAILIQDFGAHLVCKSHW